MNVEDKGIMQGIAHGVEGYLRRAYKCNEFDLGEIVTANHIRNYKGAFYHCMAMVLIKYYSAAPDLVDAFVNDIDAVKEIKMDEIDNEEAKRIYLKFQEVIKTVKNEL